MRALNESKSVGVARALALRELARPCPSGSSLVPGNSPPTTHPPSPWIRRTPLTLKTGMKKPAPCTAWAPVLLARDESDDSLLQKKLAVTPQKLMTRPHLSKLTYSAKPAAKLLRKRDRQLLSQPRGRMLFSENVPVSSPFRFSGSESWGLLPKIPYPPPDGSSLRTG